MLTQSLFWLSSKALRSIALYLLPPVAQYAMEGFCWDNIQKISWGHTFWRFSENFNHLGKKTLLTRHDGKRKRCPDFLVSHHWEPLELVDVHVSLWRVENEDQTVEVEDDLGKIHSLRSIPDFWGQERPSSVGAENRPQRTSTVGGGTPKKQTRIQISCMSYSYKGDGDGVQNLNVLRTSYVIIPDNVEHLSRTLQKNVKTKVY